MSPHTDAGALLPCPFCGAPAAMSILLDDDDTPQNGDIISAWVACPCGVEIHESRTEKEAAAKWNTRQAASQGSAGGEAFTASDAWYELVHKDDRTSPEEYPDMCLISAEELHDFMDRADVPVKTGGEAEISNGGTTYSPIGRNADGIEVYKRDARPVDAGAAQASPKPEDLWECSGCGTRKSMEQIKAEHPNARSCCPERKMGPAIPSASIPAQAGQVPEMRERAAKVAEGALICHSCGYVGAFAECCDRMNFDGASTSEIAAAIRALPLDGPSVPSAHREAGK